MDQMTLFDIEPKQMDAMSSGSLKVVNATFNGATTVGWHELFDGFNELYGITFSSGIQFMEKVFESFNHIEMIFGCEGVIVKPQIISGDFRRLFQTETPVTVCGQ